MNRSDVGENSNLTQIEYEQICEDWRHRDSMLWQSLAVGITLTGFIFGTAFNETIDDDGDVIIIKVLFACILFLFASGLNFLLLVNICKNHYYQLGSKELLGKLGGNGLVTKINSSKDYDFRIHSPSEEFLQRKKKISSSKLYKWLTNISAFNLYYKTQILLVLVSLLFSILAFGYYLIEIFQLDLIMMIIALFAISICLYLCLLVSIIY